MQYLKFPTRPRHPAAGAQRSEKSTSLHRASLSNHAANYTGTGSKLSAGPSLYVAGRKSPSERTRLFAVLTISLFFLVLVVWMFYLNLNPVPPTLDVRANASGRWVVHDVGLSGSYYENGVRVGNVVVSADGRPLAPGTPGAVLNLQPYSNVRVALDSGVTTDPLSVQGEIDNPIRRWTFTLLAFIFIGIGGPVFVKARERKGAAAFYAFCVSTALCLTLNVGMISGVEILRPLMFISLVLFACTFAYFFFEFPVPIGKTPRRHRLILSALVGGGIITAAAEVWVALGHTADYSWVRLVLIVYLLVCVAAGLGNIARSFFAETSVEIRQQLLLLIGGTGFAVGPTVLLGILPDLFHHPVVSVQLTAVSLGIMPVAFAYAITQHQLLGVRSLVRRSVVYVILGSSVLMVFSVVAAATSALVPEGWEHSEFGLLGFGFFVFLIALSFGYLQKRVERMVDRYIYHDAYDYKEALLDFSSQLASQQELDVLARQLVERTCRLMNLVCGVLLLSVEPNGEHASGDTSITSAYRGLLNVAAVGGDTSAFLEPGDTITQEGFETLELPSPHSSGEHPSYLEVHASYGSTADLMVDGLQGELSRFGVNIQPRGVTVVPVEHTGSQDIPHGSGLRSSLVDAGTSTRVGSLADAMSGSDVTEIMSNTHLSKSGESEYEMARSFLGVPLWTRQRFVGVLCLAGKRTGERFTKDDLSLLTTLGSQAALAIYNAQLSEAREHALLDTIAALAHAIEAKDGYTSEHCERMTDRAVAVAQALGLSRQEIENVRLGAILHDVGKIGVPDAVLNKPGRLDPVEYEIIKQHATIGANIVQSVKALQGVVPIVRHHQERYDGSGYPSGLSGEAIPLGARIIGVVDTYGAMTEDRVYRKAPGHERAVSELKLYAGKQFDPVVVDTFVNLLADHPELGAHASEVEHNVPEHVTR